MNIAFWEATKWASHDVGRPITVLPKGMPESVREKGVREFDSDNGIYRFYVVRKDNAITILSVKNDDIDKHCGAAQILLSVCKPFGARCLFSSGWQQPFDPCASDGAGAFFRALRGDSRLTADRVRIF